MRSRNDALGQKLSKLPKANMKNPDRFDSVFAIQVRFLTCACPRRTKNRRTDQETANLNNANFFTDAAFVVLCLVNTPIHAPAVARTSVVQWFAG
jgi:hypothetical protein